MSSFDELKRNLDLLKAAQLMLKHGISPEGELQAALSSLSSPWPEQTPCRQCSCPEGSQESSDASA